MPAPLIWGGAIVTAAVIWWFLQRDSDDDEKIVEPESLDNSNEVQSLLNGYENLLNYVGKILDQGKPWLEEKVELPEAYNQIYKKVLRLQKDAQNLLVECNEINWNSKDATYEAFQDSLKEFLKKIEALLNDSQNLVVIVAKLLQKSPVTIHDFVKEISRTENQIEKSKSTETLIEHTQGK